MGGISDYVNATREAKQILNAHLDASARASAEWRDRQAGVGPTRYSDTVPALIHGALVISRADAREQVQAWYTAAYADEIESRIAAEAEQPAETGE